MSETLAVYVVQTDIVWENVNQNLLRLQWHIQRTEPGSLVVLSEMFATGFTMNPEEFAQDMNGLILTWMKEVSINRCICGTVAIEEGGKYFNRFIAVSNGEIIAQYDKKYLFSLGSESERYQAGNQSIHFEYEGWTIAPFICYELRFPEWIRKQAGVDIMLFPAHWPKSRISAWNALLKARAIENQCFIIGANRVGNDVFGFPHTGCSQVLDYLGLPMVAPIENKEVLIHQVLEKNRMYKHREKFPFLQDIDHS